MKKMFLPLFVLLSFVDLHSQEDHLNRVLNTSVELATQQYILLEKALPDSMFPRTIDSSKQLVMNRSTWWTSGFFPASLWYLYELTGNDQIRQLAVKKTKAVEKEKFNVSDHDIGFKIFCPFGNALRITRDSSFLPPIIQAAKTLSKRFDPRVGLIRSWGSISNKEQYLVIIDNMMNLELLFAATRFTGDSSYYKIAITHADNTLKNHFRPDGSSYHLVVYNPSNGAVMSKETVQGLGTNTAWSRGQSWGLYGYTVCYRETRDMKYLEQAKRIANFMIKHPSMPKDGIPLWDLDAAAASLRDASSGAILASALLELSQYSTGEEKILFTSHATKILNTLSSSKYRTQLNESQNFLLNHSVGHFSQKSEVDVPLSYADYYYLEAILRWKKRQ